MTLANGTKAKAPESGGRSPKQTAALTARLFTRMGSMFGLKWTNNWAGQVMTDVLADWADAIHQLDERDIEATLADLRNSGAIFPPSQPQFLAMVRERAKQRRGATIALGLGGSPTARGKNALEAIKRAVPSLLKPMT